MSTESGPSPRDENAVTAADVERAEHAAAAARERAARAGLSAAHSFEESAVQHDRVAEIQDWSVEQGVSHTDVHHRSALKHRQAAEEDRKLARLKREESEADLTSAPGTD
ncbi:hypothetical protein MYCO108962_04130 [Mycobacterium colombiense]|uniref:Uncharacterized protein n=1 Tax=Mycobacterium colombiense CECT 3035 TaxID=1041522 RepID=J4SFC3_9MYCO|nr:hypothetical protein [Mycobacterium colombiense]EJO87850.1 hypothetical protein MCOL_V217818 [Mycobacterium colombiense CECT 3035]